MTMSSKIRYALRALLELARNGDRKPASAKSISIKQDIPVAYLEQIFCVLGKAGLVKSMRGPGGGYMLGRLPSKITVGDITRAFEGHPVFSKCLTDDKCERIGKCVARDLWLDLSNKFEEILDEFSLEDALDKCK